MSHPKHSKEARKQAYNLYWTDRKGCSPGEKPGKYSLSEISRITGMHRSYVSRVARGLM